MILDIDNPVYNTIIVFSIVMLLIYVIKPETIYDNNKGEFRQFGVIEGKTLLPIYILGLLLAILLYVLFYCITRYKNSNINTNIRSKVNIISPNIEYKDIISSNTDYKNIISSNTEYKNICQIQDQQIKKMQTQIEKLVDITHKMNNSSNIDKRIILPNTLNI